MALWNKTLVLLFMYYCAGIVLGFNKTTDMQSLVTDMFESYNKDASPAISRDTPITLQMEMYLNTLISLDTKEQSITARGYIEIRWTDPRLSWEGEESKYGGLERVVVRANLVWLPEIAYSSSTAESMFRSDFVKLSTVAVYSNGSVRWMQGGVFSANCAIHVERFPYDDQICFFYVGSWTSTTEEILLKVSYPTGHNMTMRLKKNSEWNLVSEKHHVGNDKTNAAYIKFYVQFSRKSKYYNSHFVAFMVLLFILLTSTFLIPVDTNDKTKAGLQIMVSFSVIYLAIKDQIPETSEGIPIITIILLTFMSINTVVILISVMVTCIHHGDFHKLSKALQTKKKSATAPKIKRKGYQSIEDSDVDGTSYESTRSNTGSSKAVTAIPDTKDNATPNAACYTAESDSLEQASRDLALRINYCCFVIFCIVGLGALLIFLSYILIHTPSDIGEV